MSFLGDRPTRHVIWPRMLWLWVARARCRKLSIVATLSIGFVLLACAAPGDPNILRPVDSQSASMTPESGARFRSAKRIALVIGNGAYKKQSQDRNLDWPELTLAGNDADRMAAAFSARGFRLVGVSGGANKNVSYAEFRKLLDETERLIRSQPGSIVAFYFSGHGFVEGGHNELVATDTPAPRDRDRSSMSVEVAEIAQRFNAAGSGMNIFFLDACREVLDGRGGLADERPPANTFIGFAAYFDSISREVDGQKNSVYTAELLNAFEQQWDNLVDLHVSVAANVAAQQNLRQIPVYRIGSGILHAPLRLALSDPETIYARLNSLEPSPSQETNARLAAARCAAGADMAVVMEATGPKDRPIVDATFSFEDKKADLAETLAACQAAYSLGDRDPATLRGYVLTSMANFKSQGTRPSDAVFAAFMSKLFQAAEAREPYAEFFVALLLTQKRGASADEARVTRTRLLRAAESGQPGISTTIALVLMNRNGEQTREAMKLDRDPAEAFRILQRAAQNGNLFAIQTLASGLLQRELGNTTAIEVRDLIRRALATPVNTEGLRYAGTTGFQTLYIMAIDDALQGKWGPRDLAEYVRLAVAAEPFFPQVMSALHFPPRLAFNTGCMLTGRLFDYGVRARGVPTNAAMAMRFFRIAASAGDADARTTIELLQRGQPDPCRIDWRG